MLTTPTVSAERQVQFIRYIQRIFIEGDFSATYKFALLHALADLCVETPVSCGGKLELSLDDIAKKFITLYWQHTIPYTSTNTKPALLKQNTGEQSKLVTELYFFREEGLHSASQLQKHKKWRSLLAQSKKSLKDGPLWRLQKLNNEEDIFLYPHIKNANSITLNDGIADCFRCFYDLVVGLTRTHWIQKIRSYPSNNALIGDKGNLEGFLFGSERRSLDKVKLVLREFQSDLCFYCGKKINKGGQVDHFIPWSRYPVDLIHNFVLAHAACNNNKRAHIAAIIHRDNWKEQNIEKFGLALELELSSYFTSDIKRSEAVTEWAYQQAKQNNSLLWRGINDFIPYV